MADEINEYAAYTPPSGGGSFLKFENNKEVMLRIGSDTVVFETAFDEASPKNTKYAWVVYDFADDQAKIMQLPLGGYKSIAQFGADADYGNPKNYNIKITRSGTGFDTTYKIVPSPKQTDLEDIAPGATEKLQAIDIIDVLSRQDKNDNVYWLKDLLNGNVDKALNPKAPVRADDYPAEDIENKPIDLSEIPF